MNGSGEQSPVNESHVEDSYNGAAVLEESQRELFISSARSTTESQLLEDLNEEMARNRFNFFKTILKMALCVLGLINTFVSGTCARLNILRGAWLLIYLILLAPYLLLYLKNGQELAKGKKSSQYFVIIMALDYFTFAIIFLGGFILFSANYKDCKNENHWFWCCMIILLLIGVGEMIFIGF